MTKTAPTYKKLVANGKKAANLFKYHNDDFLEEVNLYVCENNDGHYRGKFFGLYSFFTERTQHIYGTPEELYFILAASKYFDGKEEYLFPEAAGQFYRTGEKDIQGQASELAEADTVAEMKRIASFYKIEIAETDEDEIYDKYFDGTGIFLAHNYFYWHRQGKQEYYYYKLLLEKIENDPSYLEQMEQRKRDAEERQKQAYDERNKQFAAALFVGFFKKFIEDKKQQ